MPTRSDSEMVPFTLVWAGHLATGALVAAAIALLTPLGGLLLSSLSSISVSFSPGGIVLMCLPAWLAAESVSAVCHHAYAAAKHHPSPGGWLPPVWMSLLYLVCYPSAALMVFDEKACAAVVLAVTAAVTTLLIVTMAPWRPGMTRADARQAWRETLTMTHEHMRQP